MERDPATTAARHVSRSAPRSPAWYQGTLAAAIGLLVGATGFLPPAGFWLLVVLLVIVAVLVIAEAARRHQRPSVVREADADWSAHWYSLFMPGGIVGASMVASWLGDSPESKWMVLPLAVCAGVATLWTLRRYEYALQRTRRR